MRLLFAGQTYQPSTNGPAVFTTNLAEALAHDGHQVMAVVPSLRGRAWAERRNGVQVRALPALVSRRTGVAVTAFPNARLRRLLESFEPQLVHIQDHYPTSRAVLAESRRRGIPVVATNHFVPENMALQLPVPAALTAAVESALWWTVRAVFRRVELATAPSETAARLLRRRLPALEVRAISCGVDVERFHPRPRDERTRLRRRFDLPGNGAVGLYVGRLDRDKNLERLLDALPRVPSLARMVVAGTGLQHSALRRRARDLGLDGRVQFTGYVPDDALPELYAACDLFVMPGAVELLSIASLEAMASGLPLAAARAGALPELVRPGRNGVLFDPGDASDVARTLERLAAAPGSWQALARQARATAETHRIERTRDRYAELYREVLALPARQTPSRSRAPGANAPGAAE